MRVQTRLLQLTKKQAISAPSASAAAIARLHLPSAGLQLFSSTSHPTRGAALSLPGEGDIDHRHRHLTIAQATTSEGHRRKGGIALDDNSSQEGKKKHQARAARDDNQTNSNQNANAPTPCTISLLFRICSHDWAHSSGAPAPPLSSLSEAIQGLSRQAQQNGKGASSDGACPTRTKLR